jgi:hypothetical protein
MNLDGALYLQRHGYLTPEKNRLLDIGPQNVYSLTPDQVSEFVSLYGRASVSPKDLDLEKRRLVYYSTPRPGERTTLLSEITDLVGIEYNSIDVCPGLKTEILDLNFDPLPERLRCYHDVVMNFGTTEHIFNQWNCFEVIHDATKVGGVMYHQLPGTGYLDHGYYCYTPLFFKDMAAANGYEVLDLFIHPCGESRLDTLGLSLCTRDSIFTPAVSLPEDNRIPSLNIHAVLRKTSNAPFKTSLEIATAHAPVNRSIAARYGVETDTLPSRPSQVLRTALWPLRKAKAVYRKLTAPPLPY